MITAKFNFQRINQITDEIEQIKDCSTASLMRLRDLYKEALEILQRV